MSETECEVPTIPLAVQIPVVLGMWAFVLVFVAQPWGAVDIPKLSLFRLVILPGVAVMAIVGSLDSMVRVLRGAIGSERSELK